MDKKLTIDQKIEMVTGILDNINESKNNIAICRDFLKNGCEIIIRPKGGGEDKMVTEGMTNDILILIMGKLQTTLDEEMNSFSDHTKF